MWYVQVRAKSGKLTSTLNMARKYVLDQIPIIARTVKLKVPEGHDF